MASNPFRYLASRLPPDFQYGLRRWRYARQIRASRFDTGEPDQAVMHEYVRPGDWVVDVGANIGQFSLLFSNLVGPRGRVLSFEPVPTTFAMLAGNVRHFRHPNVTLINAALSDAFDELSMAIPSFETGLTNFYQAHLVGKPTDASALSVLTVPFDALRVSHAIAFIKIDAEGHDERVMSGMLETIRRDRPALLIETVTDRMRGWLAEARYEPRSLPDSPNTFFLPAP